MLQPLLKEIDSDKAILFNLKKNPMKQVLTLVSSRTRMNPRLWTPMFPSISLINFLPVNKWRMYSNKRNP